MRCSLPLLTCSLLEAPPAERSLPGSTRSLEVVLFSPRNATEGRPNWPTLDGYFVDTSLMSVVLGLQ